MNDTLDERLNNDTLQMGRFDDSLLLLSKNALFPWFILVPDTTETEYHRLSDKQQIKTQQHINAIARFIEMHFATDKINIATIGNIVSQLHIHIIGRSRNDACWPNVVWGTPHSEAYEEATITGIKAGLRDSLKEGFQLIENS